MLKQTVLIALLILSSLVFLDNSAWATNWCDDATNKGCWLINEGTGTEIADSSSNSNTGTFASSGNPAWAAISGTGSPSYTDDMVSFDGSTSDYITTAVDVDIADTEDITITQWLLPDSFSTKVSFAKGSGSSNYHSNYFIRLRDTTEVEFGYYSTTYEQWRTTSANLSTSTWNHIALTYTFGTGSSIIMYVNGVAKTGSWTDGNGNGTVIQDNNTNNIGGWYAANGWRQMYDGDISETSLFNDIKSSTDINDIMDNGLVQPFEEVECSDNTTPYSIQVCKICAVGDNCTDEDYNTISAWEAAKQGDLVSAKQIRVAECYDDDGDLNSGVTISGSTTSSDYYLKITSPVGERHNGTEGSGFAINGDSVGQGAGVGLIKIEDNYTVVEWLELYDWDDATYGIQVYNADEVTVRNNLLHDATRYEGIKVDSLADSYIYNNILYNITHSQGGGIELDRGRNNAYNNTAYNCYFGFQGGNLSTNVLKNNIAVDSISLDFTELTDVDEDYNASSDSTATGANSITTASTSDFVSVVAGSEDFHLVSGAVEIGEGFDLSSIFDTDIDGDIRSAWDIGADEYQAPSWDKVFYDTIIYDAVIN